MSYNWKQFTRRIPINAPAKAIYDAWTTQQGLESWFLRLAQFIKNDGSIRLKDSRFESGDKYKWLWYGYDDSVSEEKEILFANNWDKVQFSFSGGCIVTVLIKQEDGATICELIQDMPMTDIHEQMNFYLDCGSGWSFYLVNLKSVLEGGHDLRNKNVNLKQVINA